jgi:iron complex outermembrane receptor protein
VGAENVFDEYPSQLPTGARPPQLGGTYGVNNYFLPFSGFAPFGVNGRFVYGRLSWRF